MRGLVIAVAVAVVGFAGVLLGLGLLLAAVTSDSSSGCGALSGAGQPPLVAFYAAAAARYGLGPDGVAYLAAINEVETRFGTDVATSSAGAVGWMQFEPATFARYGVSVTDPAAPADPDDPEDAIFTAARYLRASGAPSDWAAALLAYDHAGWYVSEVESVAAGYLGADGRLRLTAAIAAAWGSAGGSASAVAVATLVPASSGGCGSPDVPVVAAVPGQRAVIMPSGLARPPAQAPVAVQRIIAAGDQVVSYPYCWGGGHGRLGVPSGGAGGGAIPCEGASVGFDCSGSTSAALAGAGLLSAPLVSGAFMGWGAPGPGRWVTVYPDAGHVFFTVAGIAMDTVWLTGGLPAATRGDPQDSPAGLAQTGPRWQPASIVSAQLAADPGLADPRHPEGL